MPRRPAPRTLPSPSKLVAYCTTLDRGPAQNVPWWSDTWGEVVADRIEDDRMAARPIEERPAFMDAVATLADTGSGRLLVPSWSTLGSDPVRIALVDALLRMYGATLQVLKPAPAPVPVLDHAMLVDALLRFEFLARSMRIRVGVEARRRRDEAPGGEPPYGFTVRGGRVVPNPAEERAITLMVGMRADGGAWGEISARLLEEGLAPRRGGAWRPQTMSNIVARARRREDQVEAGTTRGKVGGRP